MSGGFANPIIGGSGGLAYPSIHSPNYAAGSAGWTINKDGSAELNNVTVRGTLASTNWVSTAAGEFFYSGAPALGNLVASIAPAPGTDPYGNAYLEGIAAYSSSGSTWAVLDQNGSLRLHSASDNFAGAQIIESATGYLQIISGLVSASDVSAQVAAMSKTGSPNGTPQVLISQGAGAATTTALLEVEGDIAIPVVGNGLRVKEGTNARMGRAQLAGGTVTVANTSITASTRIFLTPQTSGANSGFVYVSARVAGTSFTISSSNAADGNSVAWFLVEPA